MNIHKFNVKPIDYPAKTIKWLIPDPIRRFLKKLILQPGKFTPKTI